MTTTMSGSKSGRVSSPRRPARFALPFAIVVALLLSTVATAQSGRRGAIMIDDGDGLRVLSYTEPDIEAAVAPDVVRSDLRMFTRELSLSEAQQEAVSALIAEYVVALERLVEEQMPKGEAEAAGPRKVVRRGGGPGGPGGMARKAPGDEEAKGEDDERNAVREIIADELRKAGFDVDALDDFPVRPSVSVGVEMGEPSNPGEPPEPDVDVSVSFGGGDDNLSDEMRGRLQAAADKMVPRIAEQVKGQIVEQMMRDMQQGGPGDEIANRWREIEDLRAKLEKLLERKRALRRELMANVQAMLAEVQMDMWPRFDRRFTRAKTMDLATLDGEGTDLVAILEKLELTDEERQAIDEVLAIYEEELHQALLRRNAMLEDVDAEIDRALYEGKGERAMALTDRMIRSRLALRALYAQYVEAIAAGLGETTAEAFRAAARADAHPQIYRSTIAQRAFEQALELDALDEDVKAAITGLHTEYEQMRIQADRRIVGAVRKQQAEAPRESIKGLVDLIETGERGERVDPMEAVTAEFRARRELDARTMSALYGLLAPEQVAQLPKIPTIDIAEPVQAHHVMPGGGSDDN